MKYIIDDELIKEWDWEKNDKLNLSPNTLTSGSNKKAWWKCSNNHSWYSSIEKRTSGRNCPYCSNHRILKGYNDLETKYPNLVLEWNYEKNSGIMPNEIFPNTNKMVWWICSKGHEWQASPNHRVSRNDGCPYCSNHKVKSGYNDLETIFPNIAKEWHLTKNGDLKPSHILSRSSKKVWWMCKVGHEWQATISSRSGGNGCPICKKELKTSFPEQAIYFYLKKLFPDAINRYNDNGKELDIYIPEINIGIEYDGMYYHTAEKKQKENIKDKYFNNKNILVLRIKEKKDISSRIIKEQNIFYYSPEKSYKYLDILILKIIDAIYLKIGKIRPSINVSIEKDSSQILEMFLSYAKEHSILINHILASEWNYDKNGTLNPEFITCSSRRKVWWICSKGHEWQATVAGRNAGSNCPFCANQKILSGYNDLQSCNPKLANEWHPTKNGNLKPCQISSGSSKKVWWICCNGHEWQANIHSRNKGAGCPYCSNQKASIGKNDLMTINPAVASQWHPDKNGDLKPNMVTCGSGKKVWWKCAKGHEWQASINNRVKGTGCPYCFDRKINGKKKKQINVYNSHDLSFFKSFNSSEELCKYFNIDYNLNKTIISLVCTRKQKFFKKKYVLRYDYDDDIKHK